MVRLLKEIERTVRKVAQDQEKWRATANEIRNAEDSFVAECITPAVAQMIVATHNVFLPVVDALLMSLKKRQDRQNMRQEVRDDATRR